jgi:predicted AAA+ superfamily ATPase
VRRLAIDDPSAFVQGLPEPVVLDEFQRAPDLLAAIKAQLNKDRRPGRFILAGSARHDVVPELADYLTGRVELLTLWPFAMAELAPGVRPIVDRLFDGTILDDRRTSAMARPALVDLVLRGGYPIAVELDATARRRWFSNLAELVVERLAVDVAVVRRTDLLGRFLRLTAARTAQVLNASDIGRELGIGRDLAGDYLRYLELAYLAFELPAWSTNLTARVTKRPKLHMVDSGLAGHLQGLTAERLSPVDPAAVSRFGSLLETFVVTEVLKQSSWADTPVRPFHFRTADGVEVDLVLESADGRVCAIEIKAGSQVSSGATRGLEYLRDRLGDRFVAGVLLTSGPNGQRISNRLATAPIDALWT